MKQGNHTADDAEPKTTRKSCCRILSRCARRRPPATRLLLPLLPLALTRCCTCVIFFSVLLARSGSTLHGLAGHYWCIVSATMASDQHRKPVLSYLALTTGTASLAKEAIERMVVGKRFADVPLGLDVIGENVVLERQEGRQARRRLAQHSQSPRPPRPPSIPTDGWLPLVRTIATTGTSPAAGRPAARPCAEGASDASGRGGGVLVAAFLAGPVRSLLTPSVHRTIAHLFWGGFGGRRVLFARLYDVQRLDAAGRRRLLCVLESLAGGGGGGGERGGGDERSGGDERGGGGERNGGERNGGERNGGGGDSVRVTGLPGGEWSAPSTSGKSFLPNASALLRCRFAGGTQLAQYAYMVQSLERQLDTLRACFERLVAFETTWRVRFDWVLRTRTDTAFLRPARPHCQLDGQTVYHARSFAKGGDVHHMFADHAAAVPRGRAEAFFVGVGRRLASCAGRGERMPPSSSEPESFIHHALVDRKVRSESALWLAPLVVSTDGRMGKWCGRYSKLGVAEVKALGPSQAACEGALLAPHGRWADVAAAAMPTLSPERLRWEGGCAEKAVAAVPSAVATEPSAGAKAASTAPAGVAMIDRTSHVAPGIERRGSVHGHARQHMQPGGKAACTWANGCCVRHPGACQHAGTSHQ